VSCPRPGDCAAIGEVGDSRAGDWAAIGEVGDFNLNTASVMPRQMGGWWNGKTWTLADG
jgi:hypothetical protein